jgi:molybdenum cofactor synthesis domain-containing protein
MVTAAILVIGNEILSGRTRDANVQYLGTGLAELGIRLVEVRIVEDDTDAIIAALNALRTQHTYVFTTGGIGPTHDDITSATVARAFGLPLVRHPDAVRRLQAYYGEGELNEARLKMTEVPDGATLIDNPVSAAPGFTIGNVHVLAGIPRIMQVMFDSLRPNLKGGPKLLARTVTIFIREGDLAAGLTAVQEANTATAIGSYPMFEGGRPVVAVVVRGSDADAVDRATEAVFALAARLGAMAEEG